MKTRTHSFAQIRQSRLDRHPERVAIGRTCVEPLEARIAPAALITGTLSAVLDESGNLTITDVDGSNTNALSAVLSDTMLVITDSLQQFQSAPAGGALSNGDATLTIPRDLLIGSITFNTGDGNDTLTLDLSGGNFINEAGLFFNGGVSVGDHAGLTIFGGATTSVTHSFANAHDGTLTLAGTLTGAIHYTGLEPIDDRLEAGTRTFTFSGVADAITLVDSGGEDGMMTIGADAAQSVTFTNPSVALVINAGCGNDTVHINGVDSAFHAALTIDGGLGTADVVTFNTSLSLGSEAVTGALSVIAAETVHLNAALIETNGPGSIDAGAISLSGAVVLDTSVMLHTDHATGEDGSISFGGTIDLEANVLTHSAGSANTSIAGSISGTGGLTKLGAGTLTLTGANLYTGKTSINAGTLALVSTTTNNNIASSSLIDLKGGATLDVTGLDNGSTLDTLQLAAGQTIQGFGTVAGKLRALSGSTVALGMTAGTLNTGDFTLDVGAAFAMQISKVHPVGDMLTFNGIDQGVSISSLDISPAVVPVLTASAWVKRTAMLDPWGAVFSNDDGGYDRALMVYADGNYHIFAGRDIDTGIPSVLGQMDFMSVTWSSSAVTMYQNGVQVFTTSGESGSSGELGTGIGMAAGVSWMWAGSIDEVSFWNGARTPLQLEAEMASGLGGNESGLVALYHLNEGAGTTTADSTAKASTGSLFNSPTWGASVFGKVTLQEPQVSATGSVKLNGATLNLSSSPGFVPMAGEKFTILTNDGTDAISGRFNGLPEGAKFPNFLGSGLTGTITYAGGTGNDVVITAENGPDPSYAGLYAVASSRGGALPVVRIFDVATGMEAPKILAYEKSYRDGVRLAVGDLNGDGFMDIITATRSGSGRIRVFDGLTHQRFEGPLSQINAFGKNGAYVAVGDVNGDGTPDIIAGSGLGGGAVKVFNGLTGALLSSESPFGRAYHGGVRVAAADLDGDGRAELIAGQGSFGSMVHVTYSRDRAPVTIKTAPAPLRDGVFVAAGDVTGDGIAELIVGRGSAGGRGRASVDIYEFRGNDSIGGALSDFSEIDSIGLSDSIYRYGARVSATDINHDGIADILVGAGPQGRSRIQIFDGVTHSEISHLTAFPNSSLLGVFTAASGPAMRDRT